ncbi:MAG TPA: hypothetical protein PLD26_11915, partial [Smithella sp.]|nr:hypothetical protein [Smithella sp.]
MKWKKLGRVYCPSEEDPYTHAMFPVVEVSDNERGRVRIYYTHRDKTNYGFPTYMDASIVDDKFSILYNHHEPIIEKAALGNFDDSGVNVTSIVKINGRKRFYYYGWNLGVTVPFRNSIGVAEEAGDGDMLKRLYAGPMMDRLKEFPNLCATPCVLKEGDAFKMWFASGEPWQFIDGKPAVACHIGYAESENGLDWKREKVPAVGHQGADHVVSTPCVLKDGDVYKMWYSYRGLKYRIGYAESADGRT